jgi:hypothetical protein
MWGSAEPRSRSALTTSGGDYDLAAALLLGAESGLLSVAEIRRIVDRERLA